VLTPGSVDLYNPKVVRSAMGAHLRLPLLAAGGWEQITGVIGSRRLWLADPQGSVVVDAVDWTEPSALIIGGEAAGAGAAARAAASGRVVIPMAAGESLNAAAAAAVFCFEAARQVRQHAP
jgi:TrmH family RNA methyltransferase